MVCPPGFVPDTIAVHERQPQNRDRLIYVCMEPP